MRLDQHIALLFGLSRAQATKAVREGLVRLNGCIEKKPSKTVSEESRVEMTSVTVKSPDVPSPSPSPHVVLYEDAACLIINKPQGIDVYALLAELKEEYSLPSLALAHRLDKGTSGCLLIAKNPAACDALQSQFKERTIEKVYLAIVAGIPKEAKASIEAQIGRSLIDRKKMSLFRTGNSRTALTMYRTLATAEKCSLLECRIATGRTHQIRVHLNAIGHPILGDETYGNDESRKLSEKCAITLPCLHAASLTFVSPATEKSVAVQAPPPKTFHDAMKTLHLPQLH